MADTSNQYTKKTIEALTLAKQLASKYQAPEVGVVHVLRALFDQPDSFYVRILEKLDIDPKQVSQMIDSFMNSPSYNFKKYFPYPFFVHSHWYTGRKADV